MQTLNQDIKSGEFKQIYLLYGEEAFLKNSYKNRLKEAIIGDDTMNFARFEGKGLDVDELIRLGSDVRTAGMLSGKAGFVCLHMGGDDRALSPVFEALERTSIPVKTFQPTHVGLSLIHI